MRKLLPTLLFVSATAFGQNSCETALPFVYGCEFFSPPVTDVSRCYTFSTGGTSAYYDFFVTANCSNDVGYVLYTGACDFITFNTSGIFFLQADTPYVICAGVDCTTSGGILAVCPYEEFSLPVQLLYFKAAADPDGVLVSWATATEQNSWYFVLSKSEDASNWSGRQEIQAAGNSQQTITYRFVDHEPALGISYYKLDQVDLDGRSRSLGIAPMMLVGGGISSSIDPYDLIGRRVK